MNRDHCPACGRRIPDTAEDGCEALDGQRWCIAHLLEHFGALTAFAVAVAEAVDGYEERESGSARSAVLAIDRLLDELGPRT